MQYRSLLHPLRIALLSVAISCLAFPPGRVLAQANSTSDLAPASSLGPGATTLLLPARQDTTVAQQAPAANFDVQPELRVGVVSGVDTPLNTWSLLQWDLGAIPPGSAILSATLGLYQTTGATSPMLIACVLQPWSASKVTWNTLPESTICDRTWTPSAATGQYVRHDITKLVNDWVNSAGSTPNNGLLLRPGTQLPDMRVFASTEAPLSVPPLLRVIFTLPQIRVCYETAQTCKPVPGAEVFSQSGGQIDVTDSNGLIDSSRVTLGDALWARVAVAKPSEQSTLYYTSGRELPAEAPNFQLYPDSDLYELRLVVRQDQPLLLYDLNVSAQWYLQDDPERVAWLRANLVRASDFLYDFTEGQFALGTVTVRQMYEGWEEADIKLHTSNVLHPNANIGGVVVAETPDIVPSIAISYTPGSVYMGSHWNRFGTPPNQEVKYQGAVVPPSTMAEDWAVALAHELGHYLLFLFDTYTDQNGVSSEAIAAQCVGSAMGNAYLQSNHAFVASQATWDSACPETEAHFRLAGRTEWATITGWYDWAAAPTLAVPGVYPPVSLTNVVFVPPAAVPPPLASQVYSLTYQLDENSSGEARAFLLRDDSLIFEQGKPAKGTTSVQLTDARVGDRLCVYDLNDHAESPDTPRHQFGCEIVAAGDAQLVMTHDPAWSPLVTIEQTGPQQLSVSVEQDVAGGEELRGRLIAETEPAGAVQTLVPNGSTWSTVFNLAEPVMPVYLQLWVEEGPAAPQTRREVIADRGTGGDGAFGPARLHSGVMAVSSDGNASYQSDEPVELGPGESIAWQSMPGTPPVPPWKRISGQSYRLDAFPASLVSGGTVSIEYVDEFGLLSAARRSAAVAAIHFWDGSAWLALPSIIATPASAEDGVLIASAPSQGVGVYAVLIDSKPALFLPQIRR